MHKCLHTKKVINYYHLLYIYVNVLSNLIKSVKNRKYIMLKAHNENVIGKQKNTRTLEQ